MSAFDRDYQAWLREYWAKTLADAGGVSQAARLKGVNRTHLHAMMRTLGIKGPKPKAVGNWGGL